MKLTGKIGTLGWSKFLLNEETRTFKFQASAIYNDVAFLDVPKFQLLGGVIKPK